MSRLKREEEPRPRLLFVSHIFRPPADQMPHAQHSPPLEPRRLRDDALFPRKPHWPVSTMKIDVEIEPPAAGLGATYTSCERVRGVAKLHLQRNTTVTGIDVTLLGMGFHLFLN